MLDPSYFGNYPKKNDDKRKLKIERPTVEKPAEPEKKDEKPPETKPEEKPTGKRGRKPSK